MLRERKQCKVVLILNEGMEEWDKDDFKALAEKVVDRVIIFTPTPEECLDILKAPEDVDAEMRASVSVLKITNIRVLKRILRSIEEVRPLLSEFDRSVFQSAIRSLVLLAWGVYEPRKAPGWELLNRWHAIRIGLVSDALKPGPAEPESTSAEEMNAQTVTWSEPLNEYNFKNIKEFDRVLYKGLVDGYFNEEAIKREGRRLNEQLQAGEKLERFYRSWDHYHDSFDNNEKQAYESIWNGFFQASEHLGIDNTNEVILFFRSLDLHDFASNAIARYVNTVGDIDELLIHVFDHPRFDRLSGNICL